MSKDITLSDEVYRKLKREKGDRSFSEIIAERLRATNRLADVTGQGILDEDAVEAAKEGIERLSEGTLTRIEDNDT